MKKLLIISLLVLLFTMFIVEALSPSSTNYNTNLYFGSGGYVESTATQRVAGGIGQTVIGSIPATSSYIIRYGIFYINVTYSVPSVASYFGFNIEDYGIEWVKFNWTIN